MLSLRIPRYGEGKLMEKGEGEEEEHQDEGRPPFEIHSIEEKDKMPLRTGGTGRRKLRGGRFGGRG